MDNWTIVVGFALRRWELIYNDRWTGCARFGGCRFLFGRVKDVTFDAILGDDADANNAAGAAIMVHGMQNGCPGGMHKNAISNS